MLQCYKMRKIVDFKRFFVCNKWSNIDVTMLPQNVTNFNAVTVCVTNIISLHFQHFQ